MKKALSVLLVLVMVLSIAACGNKKQDEPKKTDEPKKEEKKDEPKKEEPNKEEPKKEEGSKKIGVIIYNGADNYIATVRKALEKLDADDATVELDIQDAQNDQAKFQEQLDALISKKVDGLLLNIVDFGAGKAVIDQVKATKIPTVFFNRDITKDLTEADLTSVIFFGTVAPQAGVYQGEMALDLWKTNKEMDRNKDGKLQYVMLHGGLDNAEAVARTTESVKVFTDNKVEVEELAMKVADWNTEKAKEAVDAWLAKDGDKIEVIFANNDGMAEGAVAALKEKGFNSGDAKKYIPVYGVDALASAIEKINAGEMAGTVKQNNETMAKGALTLIKNKVNGKDWLEGSDLKIYQDKVSVRMDYEKVTK